MTGGDEVDGEANERVVLRSVVGDAMSRRRMSLIVGIWQSCSEDDVSDSREECEMLMLV